MGVALVVGLILYRGRKITVADLDDKYIYFTKVTAGVYFRINEIGNDEYHVDGEILSDGSVKFTEDSQLYPYITPDLIKDKYKSIKDIIINSISIPLGINDFYILTVYVGNNMILYHYTSTGHIEIAQCLVKDKNIYNFEIKNKDYSKIKNKVEDLFKANINSETGDYIIPESELS
jgi:hypothetical protein